MITYSKNKKFLLTSHLLKRTQGWKLTSSNNRGFINERVRSGIPLNLIQQSIWNKTQKKILSLIQLLDNPHTIDKRKQKTKNCVTIMMEAFSTFNTPFYNNLSFISTLN